MELCYNGENDKRALRDALCAAMRELMEKDERVVYLDADLMSCVGMNKVQQDFPSRCINCGIQEADMISVASGLSAVGKIAFAHSFGIFATRRCFDQVFLSAAYAKNSLRILGSDAGVTAEFNGGTHMPFEDMALMRAVPGSRVIDIVDYAMFFDVVKQSAYWDGVTYMRFARKNFKTVYPDGTSFECGKGKVLRDGSDVAIFASGIMVAEALEAAKLLEADGLDAAVLDMSFVKPLDIELAKRYAEKAEAVVTAENHNVIGGLGSAVCEALAEVRPTPVERVGVRESFGEVGPQSYLMEVFHLTAQDIAAAAKRAVARK